MVDPDHLTEEERKHLQMFREATPKTRQAVENVYEIEKPNVGLGRTLANNGGGQGRAA